MTKISPDDVLRLAKLAHLELSEDEVSRLGDEISKILHYVEQLQKVNLTNYEPTYQVTGLKNVMREDVKREYGYSVKDLLKNVPLVERGHIKVRRVIE